MVVKNLHYLFETEQYDKSNESQNCSICYAWQSIRISLDKL